MLCRPPGGGPKLDRRARTQFGAGISFWTGEGTSIFLYFFAKSDLDLSIVFFCIYFVSFVLFFCQILCFGQGRGAGQE